MRDRLVVAAAAVMRARGLPGTTTREIAREAGVAEGNIYHHFGDKTGLISTVMVEGLAPGAHQVFGPLRQQVGAGTVQANLEGLVLAAVAFFAELVPLEGSLLADADLLATVRSQLGPRRRGPQRAHDAVVGYLRAEQAIGRVGPGARLEAVAALLLGACREYACLAHIQGTDDLPEPASYAADIVSVLVAALG